MSQTERIMYIAQCLNERGVIGKQHICDKFAVDGRTVKRDMEFLRDEYFCDIRYDRRIKAYKSVKPVDVFSPVRALLFYAYVNGMAKSLSLLPLVEKDVGKLTARILDKNHLGLAGAFHYRFPANEYFDIAVLNELVQSYRTRHACDIEYVKTAPEAESRFIEPLRFVNYDGQWYVLAFCRTAMDLRQFKLSRVRSARRSGEPFISALSDVALDGIVESRYGIMRTSFGAEEPVSVTVCFTGKSAGIVAGQEWHPSQKMERCNDAGGSFILLTVPVESYEEILRRVLFFGPEAEVVAPEDFREQWKVMIREMNKKFCG